MLGIGGAAVGGLLPACGANPTLPANPLQVGHVSDFPPSSWTLIQNQPLIVGRDAGGLFAFTALCTHAGCEVGAPDAMGTTVCGCHGSVFDGNGAVVRGPARSPLQHYQVTVDASGTVTIDPSSPVAAGTRTAVS